MFLESDAAAQAIALTTAPNSEGEDSDDAADQMLGRDTRASLEFHGAVEAAATALAGADEGSASLTPRTSRMRIGKSPAAEAGVGAQPPQPPPLAQKRLWGQGREILENEDADHATTEEYDATATGVGTGESEEAESSQLGEAEVRGGGGGGVGE